jgi:DNA replication protein DnaC
VASNAYADPLQETPAQEKAATRTRRGIPSRYWLALDRLEELPAVAAARAFMAKTDPRLFLVLAGAPGVGKTVAGTWAIDHHQGELLRYLDGSGQVGEFRGHDVPGLFIKAADLAADLFDRKTWGEATKAPRLAIDDLGMETVSGNGKEHFLGQLMQLLHNRYDYQRKTVITCNLTRDTFGSAYLAHDGGRLADRFREVGWFEPVAGGSRRKALGAGP